MVGGGASLPIAPSNSGCIVEYKATPGNQGVVSRPDGDRTEFLAVSSWDSRESIVGFAGDDR